MSWPWATSFVLGLGGLCSLALDRVSSARGLWFLELCERLPLVHSNSTPEIWEGEAKLIAKPSDIYGVVLIFASELTSTICLYFEERYGFLQYFNYRRQGFAIPLTASGTTPIGPPDDFLLGYPSFLKQVRGEQIAGNSRSVDCRNRRVLALLTAKARSPDRKRQGWVPVVCKIPRCLPSPSGGA